MNDQQKVIGHLCDADIYQAGWDLKKKTLNTIILE